MVLERSILHCDMNNFYASVECLYNPALRGLPLAVCGEKEMRHGIVLAKSEEAKKCGIKTGDIIFQAKEKCPALIIIEPHFERYLKYSRLAREIYCEYTDLVESFGMDECWLDVSASRLAFGTGSQIGEKIRQRIREELGLTISVGVSFNKVFAKLGSDMKKPDALTYLSPCDLEKKIWPLPVENLLGVGRRNGALLHRFGFHTIGHLAAADDTFLKMKLGKTGLYLKICAKGEDVSPVKPSDFEAPMKSVGRGKTTPKDLKTPEEIWITILSLCQEIGETLRFHRKKAGGIAIECKDRLFFTKTLQKKLLQPTHSTMTLAKEAFSLFRERYVLREPLRSVTVRAIDLENHTEASQLSLFTDKADLREEKLDAVSDRIRKKYGDDAIRSASLVHTSFSHPKEYRPFAGPGL